ncbi:UPF0669 protein v1g209471-like [Homalodisca vitripennis]|uniref:UPF0669 protein v1g209471-like n=1 Tax=Homalodisca vitripennis TaxID=197043 RepID=UPI001EEA819D|nr:UPF0669 protein v1g209471-like [Homalodisca vitripennis]
MRTLVYLFFCAVVSSLLYGTAAQVLHSVSGEVSSGNYTYYSLMYKGPITLYLYSTSGDADIYVSQFVNKPSFEPDNYCLQSSTCGLDVIHIPKSFNRPVGIAVYGHPSHEFSEYYLDVVYRQSKDAYVFEEDEDFYPEDNPSEEEEETPQSSPEVPHIAHELFNCI